MIDRPRQSFSQLPIILLLVSKNNPISSLTGITYQKLNYIHRASSRVCLLSSWGHALLWTPRVWEKKDFRPYLLCVSRLTLSITTAHVLTNEVIGYRCSYGLYHALAYQFPNCPTIGLRVLHRLSYPFLHVSHSVRFALLRIRPKRRTDRETQHVSCWSLVPLEMARILGMACLGYLGS